MMLIIRASLLSSYGKNVAKPRYQPKYSQFARKVYTSLNFRFDLPFWSFSSQSHFGAFTVKFLLNAITTHKMSNLQKNCQKPLNPRFQLDLRCLPSERHFEVVTVKLSLNAITTKKIADFRNSVTRL